MSTKRDGNGTDVIERPTTKVEEKTQEPKKYKVIIHNDDFTPMDFVVSILTSIFRMSSAAATRTMLTIHKTGVGVAGVYRHEIAETKMMMTIEAAQQYGHPLQASIEEE